MSVGEPSAGRRMRNPRDFYGGLVLVALALVALWGVATCRWSACGCGCCACPIVIFFR